MKFNLISAYENFEVLCKILFQSLKHLSLLENLLSKFWRLEINEKKTVVHKRCPKKTYEKTPKFQS